MFKLRWNSILRLGSLRTYRKNSTFSAPAVKTSLKNTGNAEAIEFSKIEDAPSTNEIVNSKGLVAAAFASLNADSNEDSPNTTTSKITGNKWSHLGDLKKIDEQITKATDVNSLLSIVDRTVLTRKFSLKIVSILAEWSSSNKINLSDFESDPRFLQLCRTLGRQRVVQENEPTGDKSIRNSEDLSTVLNITGDDEAARLISSLSVQQMIKVMSSLAHKKRRSTPLLRAIAYNITKNVETLDLKMCADLFFAMATLNFPDAVLIDRVCSDIQETLPQNRDKSSVVGSIATSLGFLRHKDTEILDTLTEWMISHADICRPHDVVALVLTLGTLGHKSSLTDQLQKLAPSEISKPSVWLDYVWSLTVLDQISIHHIDSVLSPEFINSLKVESEMSFASRKKLLNIYAYVTLFMKDYKGPMLSDEIAQELPLAYSKDKSQFVASVIDTLKSLLASEANLKKNCNSRMGFLYDAECLLDSNCISYPVDSQQKQKGKILTKVAMLALDYHDICKQTADPLGSIILYQKLLEAQGYKVLLLPYTEFNPRDKLINRVKYIEKKFKEIVCDTPRPDQ